jgi:hypothetical protein
MDRDISLRRNAASARIAQVGAVQGACRLFCTDTKGYTLAKNVAFPVPNFAEHLLTCGI